MKVLCLFILVIISGFSIGGRESRVNIGEKIEDKNVKVVVRVSHLNRLIGGLEKEDFKLFENGKLQMIHRFNEYKRKINADKMNVETNNETGGYKTRLFLLIFNLTDFNIYMQKGIEYLFEKVLKKNDQLVILANNVLIKEHKLTDIDLEKKRVINLLKKLSVISQQKLKKTFYDIEVFLKRSVNNTISIRVSREDHPTDLPENLLSCSKKFEQLLIYLDSYKQNFVYPNVKRFSELARNLEKRDLEKWAICFFKFEFFPGIKISRKDRIAIQRIIRDSQSFRIGQCAESASILKKSMDKIYQSLNIAAQFPAEKISKIFNQMNATFHTVFLRSSDQNITDDTYYKKIATDLENRFRQISRLTGGEMAASDDIEQSLQKISEKEDISYLLTYTSKNAHKKKRKIKIKMKKKEYKIIYDSE